MSEMAFSQALSSRAMPLEGHWRTVNTPLRRLTARERNVVIAGLVVTIVAVFALILLSENHGRPAPAAGCINVMVAGRTGGEVLHPCGAAAKTTCASAATFDTPRSRAIVESCREGRIKF
jgi:type II secretory pathway component PulM